MEREMKEEIEKLDMKKCMAKLEADRRYDSKEGCGYHNDKDYKMSIDSINEGYNKALALLKNKTP